MNILHVIPGLKQASGPTAFCVEVSDRLADDDTRVSILYGGEVDATCFVPKNPRIRLFREWADVSQGGSLDLVHIHSLWAPLSHAGAQWARQHRVPYVVSAHGMLAPWAMRHKWLKKRLAWWFYQKRDLKGAAMFHVTAECEVTWLRDLGFQQPCLLVPLGSDLPELPSVKAQRPEGVKTVLFVGRIYPVKGLMNLVRAWARLKETVSSKRLAVNGRGGTQKETAYDSRLTVNNIPWQLVIAGPDQAGHKAELVAEAEKLGLIVSSEQLTVSRNDSSRGAEEQRADNLNGTRNFNAADGSPLTTNGSKIPDLVFTGPVYGEEKDALHRLADLFVLPSFTENFGVVVTDALSYGIPVITTKGTPWVELMGNEESVNGKQFTVNSGRVSNDCHELDVEQRDTVNSLRLTEHAANGRCGWWIDIGVSPLAGALQEAMSISDRERGLMGECGRRLVREKYGWRSISESMRCAYEWLLHGGPTPPCVTR